MYYAIFPLGNSALTIDFGNIISEGVNSHVHSLKRKIQQACLPSVTDIVPGYSSVTIHYNPILLLKQHSGKSAFQYMAEQIEVLLLEKDATIDTASRKVSIPVCYALKYGLDLLEISAVTNRDVEEIVTLHHNRKYKVYMIGFLPGFAYMGLVDERIAVPRKADPRQEIGAGYVGIASNQTGIYPLTSPGGWQIIGKTPIKLFDKNSENPVFFKAGDEVTFYPITEDEFDCY